MYPDFLYMFYLTIEPTSHSLSQISEIMGTEATAAWMKGDKYGPNFKIRRTTSQWTLKLNRSFDADLETQLTEFITAFQPYKDSIKLLSESNEVYVNVVVNYFTDSQPPIFLNLAMVNFLSYIGAEIDFDIYDCRGYGPVSIPFVLSEVAPEK